MGGPYNSGILATGPVDGCYFDYEPAPQAINDRVSRIEAICQRHGVWLVDSAFRFPLLHPSVVSVIPGGQSDADRTGNFAAAGAGIPTALWTDLKDAGLIRADATTG